MGEGLGRKLVSKLQTLYQESDEARRLFDFLAARKLDRQDTSVERVADEANMNIQTAADLLRKIADAGAGDFKVGRHGYKTRIEWHYSLRSIGKIAKGIATQPTPVAPGAISEKDADGASEDVTLIEHSFQVRPNVVVRFKLPHDLTAKEAERLSHLIRHMPFDG